MKLPDKVIGWFYLRRAGLKQDQRQMVMKTLSVEKLNLETVRMGLNFVSGQDSTPEVSAGYPSKAGRNKDSIEADYEHQQNYDIEADFDDAFDESYFHDDDAAYWDDDYEEETETAYAAEEMSAECDEVFAAYVEARQRMNQIRPARGFYPVMAVVPGQNTSKGQSKGNKFSNGSKAKGKAPMKRMPKPPTWQLSLLRPW